MGNVFASTTELQKQIDEDSKNSSLKGKFYGLENVKQIGKAHKKTKEKKWEIKLTKKYFLKKMTSLETLVTATASYSLSITASR